MVDITNLETQLAAAIAGLTGSENAQDLMVLKKSCEGTSVDTTDLDAAIQVQVDTLSGTSTTEDLLIANKASVAASGGGQPINAILEINSTEDLYIASDATEWLKTGVLETDVANYPDATTGLTDIGSGVTGVTYPAPSPLMYDLIQENGFIWALWDNVVYKLSNDFTDTGETFTLTGGISRAVGITWDGAHYYVTCRITDRVYKYDVNWVFVNTIDLSLDEMRGIRWDGSYFWVSRASVIYQFDSAFTHTGFTINSPQTLNGITLGDNLIWGVATGALIPIEVDVDVSSISTISLPLTAEGTGVVNGTYYACGNYSLFREIDIDITDYIGVQTSSTGESGLPNFTRIK